MKETKYDKNDFPDALLKEWDKTRKQILGKEGKENGDHRNCSVLRDDSRVSKTNADPPDRKKDPKEDEEQMEYLEAWKKKHERTDKEK